MKKRYLGGTLKAVVLYFFSASLAIAQETQCPQDKALEVFRSNSVVATYCKDAVKYQQHDCSYDITRDSPLSEKSDSGIAWYAIASATPQLAMVGRISKTCQMILRPPFYVTPVKIGSIELGVLESVDIVIGKVVNVQSPEPVYSPGRAGVKLQVEMVTVEVSKVLKGERVAKLTFDKSFSWPNTSAKRWLADGHERLFFVSRGRLAGTKNEDCVAAVQNAGQNEDKQETVLKECRDANEKMRAVIFGNWPNGIDLETGKNDSAFPIFSKGSNILKTKKEILDAAEAEVAVSKGMSPQDIKAALQSHKKQYLNSDTYPEAYAMGIPKGNIVVLDIPGQ